MPVTVTLPLLVTTTVYVTVSPTFTPLAGDALFSTFSLASAATVVTSASSVPVTLLLLGSFPVAVAVLSILPASTSSCVTIYV